MKRKRHIKSIFSGLMLGIAAALIFNGAEIPVIIAFALIGVLIPNLDFNFKTRVSRRTWWIHLFLIPFLMALLLPKIYYYGLFAGYYGHVLNDLDKKNNWEFATQRALVAFMWIISLVLLTTVVGLSWQQTMGLFNP